ncbi:MAG: hypothetical protein CBD03_04770 [Rhizobiales bacterium TMED143]|nr:GNAT family N-acetyltransferase [Rhodobiaceae bacterium]OUV91643.1 MAG: hypothetical protein CBD03_04770 [Rhizobiales bacterium TMED143]
MIASSPRLIFEAMETRHAPHFYALNNDPQVMQYFPSTLDHAATDAFIARVMAHRAAHGFGLETVFLADTGAFAGFICLLTADFAAPFTPAVEIGWRLMPQVWGRGLAPEGARAALAFGFGELGLEEIVSFTAKSNIASIRVMQKIGMHHRPEDDFDHPALAAGDRLRRHVLYRMRAADFENFSHINET